MAFVWAFVSDVLKWSTIETMKDCCGLNCKEGNITKSKRKSEVCQDQDTHLHLQLIEIQRNCVWNEG